MFGAYTGFTMISNPVDVAPTVVLTSYMGGQEIADIHTATISGLVVFTSTITNEPIPPVNLIKLEISRSGEYIGTWYFTETTDPKIWTVQLDTTTLENGEYLFVFTVTNVDPVDGGGGGGGEDVPFSSLLFSFTDGEGNTTYQSVENLLIDFSSIIAVTGVGLLIIIIVMKRRR